MYTNEQIKVFWVGLMDGDGSIQTNHWRKKCLQYRMVIKLLYNRENLCMLQKISSVIGGKVKPVISKKKKKFFAFGLKIIKEA